MRCIYALILPTCASLFLLGCPEKKKGPKPKDLVVKPPASQPSSAGSASSMPTDHSTSSTAITLKDLFQMPDSKNVIAKVNNEEIVRDELEEKLRQIQLQLGATGAPPKLTRFVILDGAMEQLVEAQLQKVLADKLGAKPDPKYAAAWLKDLEQRMNADAAFKTFLLRAGKNEAARKRDALRQARMDAIVGVLRKRVEKEVEAEAKKYYERSKKDFLEREGRETWRLFIKAPRGMVQRDRDIAKTKMEGLFKRLKKKPTSKTMENLAKSYSEGGKGREGGYIGWIAKGTFAPALEKKLWEAKANSAFLYEDATGYYIYFAGRMRKERIKSFKEVRSQIMNSIYRPLIDREIKKELAELKTKQKVEILIPELVKLRAENKAKLEEARQRRLNPVKKPKK